MSAHSPEHRYDPSRLIIDVRRARARLPAEHQAILDELNAQELVAGNWPGDVVNLYRTLKKRPPSAVRLARASAVWLDELRIVAFNAPALGTLMQGLDEPSRQLLLRRVAFHEYGHALSLRRTTVEHRKDGPRLLELLPAGLRRIVDVSGYGKAEIFDEVIATLYEVMVDRVRDHGYGAPEFLHPDLLAAFLEVIPWPKTP